MISYGELWFCARPRAELGPILCAIKHLFPPPAFDAMSEITQLEVDDKDNRPASLAVRLQEPASDLRASFTILYLHGFGSDQWGEKADFFRRQAADEGVPFCSFDFRGHGKSGGEMRDLSLTRNLEDVQRVHSWLVANGHARCVILGSSMGGLTGLWFAALHPAAVTASLVLAPALGLDGTLERWAGAKGIRRWRREGSIRVENEMGVWDLDWRFMEDLRSYGLPRLQRRLRTPSLILQGMRDDRVSWQRVVDFVAGCPDDRLELHLFADGDHRLIDRKERLWQLMRSFLVARGVLPDGA
jgi:pimeloyl-ACP methyl ester carboxylesterase